MLLPFHFLGIWNIQHFQSYHSWSIQQLTLNPSLIPHFQHFFMFNILPFQIFVCRSFFIHHTKHLLSFILNSSLFILFNIFHPSYILNSSLIHPFEYISSFIHSLSTLNPSFSTSFNLLSFYPSFNHSYFIHQFILLF